MAELADAHGSGPCESNFMQVQVLLSAPIQIIRILLQLEMGSDLFFMNIQILIVRLINSFNTMYKIQGGGRVSKFPFFHLGFFIMLFISIIFIILER